MSSRKIWSFAGLPFKTLKPSTLTVKELICCQLSDTSVSARSTKVLYSRLLTAVFGPPPGIKSATTRSSVLLEVKFKPRTSTGEEKFTVTTSPLASNTSSSLSLSAEFVKVRLSLVLMEMVTLSTVSEVTKDCEEALSAEKIENGIISMGELSTGDP